MKKKYINRILRCIDTVIGHTPELNDTIDVSVVDDLDFIEIMMEVELEFVKTVSEKDKGPSDFGTFNGLVEWLYEEVK